MPMRTQNTIQEQFRAAARYFEEVYKSNFGRGFQARVSEQSQVRAPYFNEILKGKKFGPEEVRRKLVEGITRVCPEARNLTYELFLDLGDYILAHGSPNGWKPSGYNDAQLPTVTLEYSSVESDLPPLKEQHPIYEFSPRDKKDKNMMLIAEWISQQEDPAEYWTLLKMFLRREEPEFKEWLKKRSTGDNQGRFPENKSAVGE